ncbi:MAG: hypothetical protein N2037_05205 [Acidimicrobiales bacterium]|nr:hypothetical protein [Acidimicrobiales bacterium]
MLDDWASGELDEIEACGRSVLAGAELTWPGGRDRLLERLDSLDVAALRSRPWTRLLVAATLLRDASAHDRVSELIRSAARSFSRRSDREGQRWAAALRVELALAQDDLAEAVAVMERSLANELGILPVDPRRLVGIGSRALRYGQITTANRAFMLFGHYCSGLGNQFAAEAGWASMAVALLRHGDVGRGVDVLGVVGRPVASAGGAYPAALVPGLGVMRAGLIEAWVAGLSAQTTLSLARAVLATLRNRLSLATAAFSQALSSANQPSLVAWSRLVQLDLLPIGAIAMTPGRARDLLTDALAGAAPQAYGLEAGLADEIRLVRARLELAEGVGTSRLDKLAEIVDVTAEPFVKGRALLHLGEHLANSRQGASAVPALKEAWEVLAAIGASWWAARAAVLLGSELGDETWLARAYELSDGDPAFAGLFARPGRLRVRVGSVPSVTVDGEPVCLPTRHAELVIQLLAVAGPEGIPAEGLCLLIWPGVESARSGPRLRTLLWQVRSALGPERWRIQRRADRVVFQLDHAQVDVAASLRLPSLDDGETRFTKLAVASAELAGVVGLASGQ